MAAVASRVALVLGVGPGLGGSVVRKWVDRGWKVAAASRGIEKGEALVKELGSAVTAYSCDVSNAEAVQGLVDKVNDEDPYCLKRWTHLLCISGGE